MTDNGREYSQDDVGSGRRDGHHGARRLGARVEVEGSDEVAALAQSFNRAAGRIESLVAVQRTMLASASFEIRFAHGDGSSTQRRRMP